MEKEKDLKNIIDHYYSKRYYQVLTVIWELKAIIFSYH